MKRSRLRQVVLVISGWVVVGAFLAPLVWMVLGSFKATVDFLAYPPVLLFRPTLGQLRAGVRR